MNQYLIMCEGTNELAIINMLIDSGKMCFTRKDLLNREAYFARQLNNPVISSAIKTYNDKIVIIRIGDKLSDELKIPKDLKQYIDKENIIKICTKPEIEILLIINEGLFKDYNKEKSKIMPKQYAKKHIKFNKQKYDNSTNFWIKYYENQIDNLVSNIKEYKKLKRNNKDEHYLADYLK